MNYCECQKTYCFLPVMKVEGSQGRIEFESQGAPENGGYQKESKVTFDLGSQKELDFSLHWHSKSLILPNTWSLDNKVSLRTALKNHVLSLGLENWDLFDAQSKRIPRGFNLSTSTIHDHDSNTRLYGGLNAGFNISPLKFNYGYALAGINYLRKHRLVVVAGGEKKGEADKEHLVPTVKALVRSKVNNDIDFYGEINYKKADKSEATESEDKEKKQGCCKELTGAVAAEYRIDPKTRIKARACCGGELVLAFLHTYGVCNFGFVSRVI